MLRRKVRSALNYLSRKASGGVLQLGDLIPEASDNGETLMRSTRDILNDKHPKSKVPPSSILLDGIAEPMNHILFDELNSDTILQAAMHTQGVAVPSGLDAQAWRHMCSSFKSASTSLCTALADVGKRTATSLVHPEGLTAFVACRLIPLNK